MENQKVKVIDTAEIRSLLGDIETYLLLINSAVKALDMVSEELYREKRGIAEVRNVMMLDSVSNTIENTTDIMYLCMDSIRLQSDSIESARDRIAELLRC